MRIYTAIIAIQLFSLPLLFAGTAVKAQVSLDVRQENIKNIFTAIEKQASVKFTYNESTLKHVPALTLKFSDKPLSLVLATLEKQTPLEFKMVGKLIAVSGKTAGHPPGSKKTDDNDRKNAKVVPIAVTGKVTDEKGDPVAGATIRITGSRRSAISGSDGEFRLNDVSGGATLTISFIGFETLTIPVSESMTIRLIKSASKLDEVQVIAYGTTTQRLNTGAVTKITAKEIAAQPVGNSMAALIGRVPGLLISQNNGVPGSSFRLQIRGQNALSNISPADVNSDPLIIIDGVPFAPNNDPLNVLGSLAAPTANQGLSPLHLINPADIESIEVLKDADATSIYGSRGAFGVILITTKRGVAGKTTISAAANSGFSHVSNKLKLLNTEQYLQMRNEAFKNDGVIPDNNNAYDLKLWDKARYTDWQEEFIGGTAKFTDAQLSLSGGNAQTQFLINGGFHHESTVFPGDLGNNRGTVHLNLNHSSTDKKFTVNLSVNYAGDQNRLVSGSYMQNIFLPPNHPSFFGADGKLSWENNGIPYSVNPYAALLNKYTSKAKNLLANLQLGYEIYPGLTIRSSFGYNDVGMEEVSLIPRSAQNPLLVPNASGASMFGTNTYNSWIIEPQLEYKKRVAEGRLTVLAGGTLQNQNNNYSSILATGYSSDALLRSIESAGALQATGSPSTYRYEALFTRINYNLKDKYLLNLTGRRDGSSRFGPGRQYGNFGAVGAAWIFSGEPLISDHLPFLSYGKIRGSYGTTGSDQIGNYQYLDSWRSTQNLYEGNPGLVPARLFNADYSWEINRKLEGAIDLGFFKDRILFSTAFYRNRSDNHLIAYALPSQTGFSAITRNFPALVENKGYEFTLTTRNFRDTRFTWTTSVNITLPENRLISFPGLASSSYNFYYQEGQSLSLKTGYQYLGVDPQTGAFRFKDQNGDNQLSFQDQMNIGSFDPKFYGGIGNQLSYSNWSLDFFLDFKRQLNFNALSYLYDLNHIPGTIGNVPTFLLDRWQSPGMDTSIPQFTASTASAAYQSVVNGFATSNSGRYSMITYLKLRNVSLTYNLDAGLLSRLKIKSCNIYLQGQNLLTISNYKYGDPENTDLYNLPPLRTIIAGIKLSL